METKDLNTLYTLMAELYDIVTISGKVNNFPVTAHNGQYAVPILKNILNSLKQADKISADDVADFLSTIKSQYESMYPPKSGLSEFYVWSDDFDTRKQISDKFTELQKSINTFFKNID